MGNALSSLINRGKLQVLGPPLPTLIRHNSKTTPDICICNKRAVHNYHIAVGEANVSDHLPIIFTLSSSPIQIPIKERLQSTKINWDIFKETLDTLPQNYNLNTSTEIDNATNTLLSKLSDALKASTPIIRYRPIPYIKTSPKSRMIQTIMNNIIHFCHQFNTNINLYKHYNALRLQLHHELNILHVKHWQTLLNELENKENKTPKQFWDNINAFRGKRKEIKITLKDNNNHLVTEALEITNIFTTKLASIHSGNDEPEDDFDDDHIEHINNLIHTLEPQLIPYSHSDPNRLNIMDISRPITLNDLSKAIQASKNTAPGPSGIRKMHLQNLTDSTKQKIIDIFNASLSMGYYPKPFKNSTILMIPKKHPAPTPSDYRPISLLEVTGKLFERILNNRLLTFLIINNLMNPNQFGFRPGRSAEMALALITETIAQHKSQNHQVSVVQRDISHAFDTIWHDGLKYKLSNLNLPSPFLRLLCSYLTDRTGRVTLHGTHGPSFPIRAGVPQGGVLAPTLFIQYTADIPNDHHYSHNISYADDETQVVFTNNKNLRHLTHNLQYATEQITQYERKWKLKTNIRKFKTIKIGNMKRLPYHILGHRQEHSFSGKTLGLNINTYGYKTHIKQKKGHSLTALSPLYRFNNCSQKFKKQLYTTLIRPILEYPIVPNHCLSKTLQHQIQITQNQAVKFITGQKYQQNGNTSRTLHKICNLETLNTRLHDRAAKLWHKIDKANIQIYEEHIKTFDYASHRPKKDFPFSLPQATSPCPRPIYIFKD
ncbi:unnamed protein product [Rotaria socialis]|uniref:Reverse transcriptase domain-containing protein n=1 Tax=Rotaria socialis TaxID=392032 RepID=A0A818JMT4_9BILA|nr:unnamed protein product [Rotaria socialis]CAF4820614.1 unnamed protein product [Rotaria socialis]